MVEQPEARISKAIMAALEAEGVFCFKVHGSALMMTGLPDIIACVDGMFVGLETKLPAKRKNTSERQKVVHEKIQDALGFAVVVCGPTEALAVIAGIREGVEEAKKSLIKKGYRAGYKKAKAEA